MIKDKADKFLLLCKQNYFDKITPLSPLRFSNENSKQLIIIAQNYFINNETTEFAEFLQEGNYLISLWTAHLLIDYGKLNKELFFSALRKIVEHSENPLAPEAAREEKLWLKDNIGLQIGSVSI